MSGQQPGQKGNTPNLPNEKVLAQLVEAQVQKVKNEAKELELRGREIDHQARYADRWLTHQAEIIKQRPNEHRKNITRLAWIAGGLITIILVFIAFCLYLNKDAFIIELIKALGYVVTTLGGYYFGRKSKQKEENNQNSPNSEPYQEVD